MRASPTSATSSEGLLQLRTAPGNVALVPDSFAGASPIAASRTVAAALATMQWAHGYSGCGGVSMNGSQPGFPSVARGWVRSAVRVAVIGRQDLSVYVG